jgi:guanosine-3',5'-bis(diphosphate) 3'-pyrophosphohydrolase
VVLIGYITRGKGITVHALGCRNIPYDHERYVSCRWETAENEQEMLVCKVLVKSANRLGLLSDLTGTVAKRNLNMANIHSQVNDEEQTSTIEFTVEVPDFFVFANLVRDLSKIPGVSRLSRIST